MHDVVDLQRYPLDQLNSVDCQALVNRCRDDLERPIAGSTIFIFSPRFRTYPQIILRCKNLRPLITRFARTRFLTACC